MLPAPNRFHHKYSTLKRTQPPDVVVVDGGVAGVCASIAAAEKGAKVLLLDDAHGGGASALSGGVVYAGGGTRQQKEAGFGHDSPYNMFAYLKEDGGRSRRQDLAQVLRRERPAKRVVGEARRTIRGILVSVQDELSDKSTLSVLLWQ